MSKTYELVEEGTGIVCLVCGMVSYNREDVRRRYCSHCKVFHDDREKVQAVEQAEPAGQNDQDDEEGGQKPAGPKKKEKKAPVPAMTISTKLGARKYAGKSFMGRVGPHFTRRRF
jgi:hypothetical protein